MVKTQVYDSQKGPYTS